MHCIDLGPDQIFQKEFNFFISFLKISESIHSDKISPSVNEYEYICLLVLIIVGVISFKIFCLATLSAINFLSVENLITLLFTNQIFSFSFSKTLNLFFEIIVNYFLVLFRSATFPVSRHSNSIASKDLIICAML